MPAALLAKIVSLVGVDGVDALKNWIKAGPEGKAAVFSKETLSTVRLDKSQHFMWWQMPHSTYFSFFRKCVEKKNPYAVFAEMNKGVAFSVLVNKCYKEGRWDPEWIVPEGGWRIRRYPIVGRPRCSRCARYGHSSRRCEQ